MAAGRGRPPGERGGRCRRADRHGDGQDPSGGPAGGGQVRRGAAFPSRSRPRVPPRCRRRRRERRRAAHVRDRDVQSGMAFINGHTTSYPEIPFGGVRRSGHGRELSDLGMREFMNAKTVWVGG
ncbi:aldehyde dehydrogenase family protein [Streptomyces griseoluteus]